MSDFIYIFFAAIILDYLIGDPRYRLHPVRLMGSLAVRLEKIFRRLGVDGIFGGAIFALIHGGLCIVVYLAVGRVMGILSPVLAWLWNVYALYSMYAHKDLLGHATTVLGFLDNGDIVESRKSVAMMVGRETAHLDDAGIGRAAIESVSENMVDGSVGVMFWLIVTYGVFENICTAALSMAIGAAVFYRCINTLDAMVGYKNEKYILFGKFSARLDDVFNYVPARLSVVALLIPVVFNKIRFLNGIRSWRKYRGATMSPNSGHSESVVAGILNVRLGGSASYRGQLFDNGWMWKEGSDVVADDIRRCIRLVTLANFICVATVLGIAFAVS